MPKVIQYELSDEQLDKLKKIYEHSKDKLKSDINTFDKFVDWTIDMAIETHIQFSSMNDKMLDMIDSGMGNIDLNNIDEFINNIFDSKQNQTAKTAKTDSSSTSNDTSTSSKQGKIKN